MKILVLNGSPKGEQSVTMQYVQYLTKTHPEREFLVRNVAHRVRSLERHPEQFDELIAEVRQADLVLWAFPLYILLVCSQYKRFIELIAERGAGEAFRGRYAATLSTSINYYDTTAHRYLQAVCDDLGMLYLGSYSANMHDLMKPEERQRLEGFAADLFASIERGSRPARLYPPLTYNPRPFAPAAPQRRVSTAGKRVVVLTDARPEQANLRAMIDRFRGCLEGEVEVLNLHDVDIKGRMPGLPALRGRLPVRLHRQGRFHRLLQRKAQDRGRAGLRGRGGGPAAVLEVARVLRPQLLQHPHPLAHRQADRFPGFRTLEPAPGPQAGLRGLGGAAALAPGRLPVRRGGELRRAGSGAGRPGRAPGPPGRVGLHPGPRPSWVWPG